MCSLTVGLMAAQMGLQMYQNNQQAHAQKAQYQAQARAAQLNQAAEEHRADSMANSYAEKQFQLNQKHKLAVGNALAQAGASGISAEGGSVQDLLSSSQVAYERDSRNLLANQREDQWASYVKQVNYLNEMNAYNQMAHNVKKQNRLNQFGTILNGVASIYGQGSKEGLWGKSSASGSSPIYSGSSLGASTNNYNFNTLYKSSANYSVGSGGIGTF